MNPFSSPFPEPSYAPPDERQCHDNDDHDPLPLSGRSSCVSLEHTRARPHKPGSFCLETAMPSEFPKCQTPMERGFILDMRHHNYCQSRWIPGDPKESWLFGEVQYGQVQDGIKVITLRCPSCGFLESYAP